MLGTNPVSSDPRSVHGIESALKDLLVSFGISEILPHCVLAHIDVQAEVEKREKNVTALFFQSIAGNDATNATFGLPVEHMMTRAGERNGIFGLYLETGQGSDFTNGHDFGCDMVFWESRKYGFARALKRKVAEAQRAAGRPVDPIVYVNDVAGFIGPEVFRTREQLVRVCIEDIVMGKLHGLMIGNDVCATLHMDISLDDLDWCLDQIVPAHPGYLMALPTKNDPMLSYLTTSFQDHVRLRNKFNRSIDSSMAAFFRDQLQVLDSNDQPGKHFGDPVHVFARYMQRKGDARSYDQLRHEGNIALARVRARGVPIATGYGVHPWDMDPNLDRQIRFLYDDAKTTLWHDLTESFVRMIPDPLLLKTNSKDRRDYVWHPPSGEQLSPESIRLLQGWKRCPRSAGINAVIVISDGLCVDAISDPDHLLPFLTTLRSSLSSSFALPAEHLVVHHGRVRAGYHIGHILFGAADSSQKCTLFHVIGERPGNGHHTFSVYITSAKQSAWDIPKKIDHDITRVVSGIADSSYNPVDAAKECAQIADSLAQNAKM